MAQRDKDKEPERTTVKLKRLAAIVLLDADLQSVVKSWPSMGPEAKAVVLKLAGVGDND